MPGRPLATLHRHIACGALSVLACMASACVSGVRPTYPVHPYGQVLWGIVHDQCLAHQLSQGDPTPCAEVHARPDGHGYAILKDRVGVAQYLLLPTDKVTGIEDPKVLDPTTPDYFAEAWASRHLLEGKLGRSVARDEIIVAVNSAYGRSQDQLHLHIDCISPQVRMQLGAVSRRLSATWSAPDVRLGERTYRALKLDASAATALRPFRRLADAVPTAARDMGSWTVAVTGTPEQDRPGFILLARRADPTHGDPGGSEELMDHSCHAQLAR